MYRFFFFFFFYFFFVFFFKQKTAYEIRNCDWSSDVCSSDLPEFCLDLRELLDITIPAMLECRELGYCKSLGITGYPLEVQHKILQESFKKFGTNVFDQQIGRASCRERVQISVVAVSLKKKTKKKRKKKKKKKKKEKKKKQIGNMRSNTASSTSNNNTQTIW